MKLKEGEKVTVKNYKNTVNICENMIFWPTGLTSEIVYPKCTPINTNSK